MAADGNVLAPNIEVVRVEELIMTDRLRQTGPLAYVEPSLAWEVLDSRQD